MLDLNEIESSIKPTTSAPWEFVDAGDMYIEAPGVPWGTTVYIIVCAEFYAEPSEQVRQQVAANLKFAAQARSWVPALVEELREARAEVARLQEYGMGLVDSLHEVRALVPTADLLYRLADYADNKEGDAALALARRIEKKNE